MKSKNINDKLKNALKLMGIIIVVLIITLLVLLTNNQEIQIDEPQENGQQDEESQNEEKTLILDIPAMGTIDAYKILDLLVREYGEPQPQGLIDILKELDKEETPRFETVTWRNIKYGYDFTFNFWSDGSLARKDTYYFTGHNRQGHNVDEVFKLTNLKKDSTSYVFNIVDYGGAVFNVGITPAEIARTPEPITQQEIDELTYEEILEILEENAKKEYPSDIARAKLEYDNQIAAYDWVSNIQEYPDIMEKARQEWGHNYIMVKWQYERDVKAHESKL